MQRILSNKEFWIVLAIFINNPSYISILFECFMIFMLIGLTCNVWFINKYSLGKFKFVDPTGQVIFNIKD